MFGTEYCIYNCLPEDGASGSKHVEDIKKLKIKNIKFDNLHFVGLCCIVEMSPKT